MKLGISIRGYEVNVGRYNIKFIIELNKIKVWMCVCLCLCLFVCLFVVVVVVCSCFCFFFVPSLNLLIQSQQWKHQNKECA